MEWDFIIQNYFGNDMSKSARTTRECVLLSVRERILAGGRRWSSRPLKVHITVRGKPSSCRSHVTSRPRGLDADMP